MEACTASRVIEQYAQSFGGCCKEQRPGSLGHSKFDRGWSELARQGCELVAWPTQSPQTVQPAFRALQHRFYIVSSTWRHNSSVFEPTGRIAAQVRPPEIVPVDEIDLRYALLPWSAKHQVRGVDRTARMRSY